MLHKPKRLFGPKDKLFQPPQYEDEPWLSEANGELVYARRSLVVLRPREPYVRWVRSVEPTSDYTLQRARSDDAIAFLIPMRQFGTEQGSKDFIAAHWPQFFAQALEQVEHDRKRWPEQSTQVMFGHWFDIELCQSVIDLGGEVEEFE